MHFISDQVERKFKEIVDLDDWSIQTDTGWQPLSDVKKTEEYQIWKIELTNGFVLECADNHIVFRDDGSEVFVKDLRPFDKILVEGGSESVKTITTLNKSIEMFDVGVDSSDHRFYSNGILSHNSSSAAAYLLWYAMFMPDSTILLTSYKYAGCQEIMQKVRFAYENVPDFIRCGVVSYNKGSIDFDNGSRILSSTTTENTGRGMALSLLYLDEFSFVPNRIAKEFWTSLSPTLSTGGKCIITSTPDTDDNKFAEIWLNANKTIDEFGNETETGINGFKAYSALWYRHPDRDEKWAEQERNKISEERFSREHECCNGNTLINLMSPSGEVVVDTIENIFRSL